MWVSLNEIETTVLKSARGAGYSWGLAEEAAAAARWLAVRGEPWLRPLTHGVLRQMHRLESIESAVQQGTAIGPSDPTRCLGPVSLLTALGDELITLPHAGGELSLRSLAAPILIMPTLARLSKRFDRTLLVRWPSVALECRAGEIFAAAAGRGGLDSVAADWVNLAWATGQSTELAGASTLRHQGAEVDDALWRQLSEFGHRNFVAESETARVRGSGAGLSDQ